MSDTRVMLAVGARVDDRSFVVVGRRAAAAALRDEFLRGLVSSRERVLALLGMR